MDLSKYDHETRALIELIDEQKSSMSEEVLDTVARLLAIAEKMDDYELRGLAHFDFADALFAFEKDYDEFRHHLARAIYYFGLTDEKALLARSYNFVAIDALNNGSYDVAYSYLMNAVQTCEELDDNYLLSIINNNIGQVYGRMGSYEKGIEYIRLSNKQQEMCSKEDAYYYQNLISGYFVEGSMYALMDDLPGAMEGDRKIAEVEKEIDISSDTSLYIPVSMLRLMIAILQKDEELSKVRSREAIERLRVAHMIYDYIEDIEDLCYFLIDHGYADTVGEIVEIIRNTVESTGVIQMKKVVSAIEIAYYDGIGDEEKATACLRDQYILSKQQQKEQNRIYQYSIELINIMDDQRKEQEKVRRENELLHSQVQTDSLTGIPNRLMLDRTTPDLFESARENSSRFAISLMDINKFKEYNDTYGHLAGDICLQKVAKAIQKVSDRPDVFCARYGGDEFVMLYADMSDEEIMEIATRLDEDIRALNIVHMSMRLEGVVTISQGICNCIPDSDCTPDDLMNEADIALYAVKKSLNQPGRSIRLVHLQRS